MFTSYTDEHEPFKPIQLTYQKPMVVLPGLPPSRAADLAPEGQEAVEFCAFSLIYRCPGMRVVTEEGQTITAGAVLLTLPEAGRHFGDVAGIEAMTLCVHADWLFETLRALWSETGLVRVLLAERLFPVRRQVIGTMVLEPRPDEFASMAAELAWFDSGPGTGRRSLTFQTGAFLKTLGLLNECLQREDQGAALPLHSAIWHVADIIEGTVAQGLPLDIGELAASVEMPQTRFARMFREATGLAPRDYIQVRRIQHGSRMLIEDLDTVTEIAQRLGYADAAHFCRVFKRIRGVPPNEYRRLHAGPKLVAS